MYTVEVSQGDNRPQLIFVITRYKHFTNKAAILIK